QSARPAHRNVAPLVADGFYSDTGYFECEPRLPAHATAGLRIGRGLSDAAAVGRAHANHEIASGLGREAVLPDRPHIWRAVRDELRVVPRDAVVRRHLNALDSRRARQRPSIDIHGSRHFGLSIEDRRQAAFDARREKARVDL